MRYGPVGARAWAGIVTATVLMGGCLSNDLNPAKTSPTSANGSPVPTGSNFLPGSGNSTMPYRLERLHLNGTILLREPVYGDPILWTGNASAFNLVIPNGTKSLHFHATWSPLHEMGLEYDTDVKDPESPRYSSWKDGTDVKLNPPADITVPHPRAAKGWAYLGPHTVGAAIDWEMIVDLEIPANATVEVAPEPPPVPPGVIGETQG